MPIQVLNQETVNKIAAGEVIERPSSVVKELVENAIDAKATAITVEIKDGGISMVRVTDNGCGIDGKEIPMAFLRHSTSKIKSVEDLLSVSSLGFRGEALSSIAAVSQIELITKPQTDFIGYRYLIEGGVEKGLEEVGAPDGTTFIVRNLFYNTPVRRKFLKSAQTEAGYINSLIEHLSLSHPDISFRFISNNQNRLHTSGNMNLKDIIYNVYGRDITKNLFEINAKTQDIEISGFIGKPLICRGNKAYENYYINGRYIKSSIITKAIEEAYKGYIMPHNFPFTAIHFKINPEILDVNVHPTKMELRFSTNEYVYNFVLDSIKSTLKSGELAPEVSLSDVKVPQRFLNSNNSSARQNYAAAQVQAPEEAKRADIPKPTASAANQSKERLPEPFEINRSNDMIIKEEATKYADNNKSDVQQLSMFDNALMNVSDTNSYRVIGQLFDTYWLIEFEDKFYMMDQHAAHEKILYEKLMNHIKTKKMDTQMIMPPIILELNLRQEEIIKKYSSVFDKVGFELEQFGTMSYKVTGVPAGFPTINYKQMLIDMIDNLCDDRKSDLEIITEKIASMSCKAAVKGNNKLSFDEAKQLIGELMKAENPYNCPHGRPTLIVMSKYEIEKKFKRIV
ncbi:MAG: DNA mismatch repair endonuclease MutL [Lachnospira sp.]